MKWTLLRLPNTATRLVAPVAAGSGASSERRLAMAANGHAPDARALEPMQPSDAFFWFAEAATPQLRPLVAGLFLLDRAPDRPRLRAAMERMTVLMPRLRQRVINAPFSLGLPRWHDDEAFDLDYHLREVVLTDPGTHRHLLRFVGEVFSTPLDHLRPLWEAQLIGGLEDGRAALLVKLHHAVMDGVGANALFDVMTQARRSDPVPPARRRFAAHTHAAMPVIEVVQRGLAVAGAAAHALADPADAARQVARFARGMGGLVADIASGATAGTNGTGPGIGRRLDGIVLSLPRMRRIKSTLGITLNDLVLTAVSGAVGRYHARRGVRVDTLTCMVPVSLRQDHERTELGNRVGGFTIQLPVGERDPRVRLARIREQTQTAKRGGYGAAYRLLMQASALIPAAVFRGFAHRMAGRIQLICSNVPGPAAARYLAGAKIDAVYPFAPVMFGTPIAIALVSYGTTYGVGIAADPAVIPDPERLGQYLQQEIDAIERQVEKVGRSRQRGKRPAPAPRSGAEVLPQPQ